MSTADPGTGNALEAARKAYDADVAAEEQMSLLDPVSPEEMVEAREELGPDAGRLSVLRLARERRRGRPKGARNKRTDDLARWLSQFGEDPLVGAMRLASTQPEVLIEASKQEKVHSFDKSNNPRIVIERMTYAEAQAIIMRARELIAPYIHGKKPVQVDLSVRGDITLIEEMGRAGGGDIVDGEFLDVGPTPAEGAQ